MDAAFAVQPAALEQRPTQLWNEIVQAVSAAELFPDSKHFVDCPAMSPWTDVREAWALLQVTGVTAASLKAFVAEHFGEPGSDLEAVLPAGWREAAPGWVAELRDPELRELGRAVYGLWKTLCRQVSPSVLADPGRHTLLPLPHPFIIPGDRFRECYNWDSYWIVQGLLASGLAAAAEQLVRNLLHLVDRWGFVPNGARSYYTNRSQPPLLSAMVLALWRAGGSGDAFLADALPRLVRQHGYWTSGSKAVRVRRAAGGRPRAGVTAAAGAADAAAGGGGPAVGNPPADGGGVPDGEGEVFELSRYHAELYGPRPESFREDAQLVAGAGVCGREAEALYCDIASAAESGWDFSSRWFVGGDSLRHTRTTQIVPADLNAWLYRTERDIAAAAEHLGRAELHAEFAARAARRLRAINELMWSQEDGCWHDLLLLGPPAAADDAVSGGGQGPGGTYDSRSALPCCMVEQRRGAYASNWVPLWCGCAEAGSGAAAAAVAGLRASRLLQPGGLLTSLYDTGQQWDAPNAWPPLVHMAVEALAGSGVAGARAEAEALAGRWVRASAAAWRATGHMHEKLDGRAPGGVGGGGEYAPQVGFGWSNGVLLALLQRYGGGAAGGGGEQ